MLAGCSSAQEESASNEKATVHEHLTKVNDISSNELENEAPMRVYVDNMLGNFVYTYSYHGTAVVPFKDLTWQQIQILQDKGVRFPQALIDEKKSEENNSK